MPFFFAIILKDEMQGNRKLCWIYHQVCKARRSVTFSRAFLKGQMNQNFDIRSLASLKQLNTKTDHCKVYSLVMVTRCHDRNLRPFCPQFYRASLRRRQGRQPQRLLLKVPHDAIMQMAYYELSFHWGLGSINTW